MSLKVYNRKRNFKATPEPRGKKAPQSRELRYVVQWHHATRAHFDFRLEFGGSYKSWAVPKGPSLNPMDQRLAVQVEEHPIAYGDFEGIIPKGNYGAGTVMIWDRGVYLERGSNDSRTSEKAMQKGFEKGHITFVLTGEKLNGEFALVRLKDGKAWLLVKKRDEFSTHKLGRFDEHSVVSGRTIEEIRDSAESEGAVWLPKRAEKTAEKKIKQKPVKTKPADRSPLASKSRLSEPMPRRQKPMVAVAAKTPPKDWIYEPEVEGVRAIAEVDGHSVRLHSRSLLPFEKKYPQVVSALKTLRIQAIFDGMLEKRGKSEIFQISDLLYFAGRDLRNQPLLERKKILRGISLGPNLEMVAHSSDWRDLKSKDWLIGKDPDSLYRSGPQKAWARFPSQASRPKAERSSDDVRLTHLDKIYWPDEKITKGDLIEYYRRIAKYILPHLIDRPMSLHRHPDGIAKPSFYQKNMTGFLPRWLKTERIFSDSSDRSIDFALCQDERSLLYLANMGCIELNPWFSRVGSLDRPDFSVIDLDPDDANTFEQTSEVALYTNKVLEKNSIEGFCKTSGATGIHILVPTNGKSDFDQTRDFALAVAKKVHAHFSKLTSLERNPNRRRGKIYLDYMQNRRGQTLASIYCVRPRPGAPVSMPLQWSELERGVEPTQFDMFNVPGRLEKSGDPWRQLLRTGFDLKKLLRTLK